MAANIMLFSIIIANYNKADNISPLLTSVYEGGLHDDFEVLFLDDASSDDSLAEAARFPVRLFPGTGRVGPATLRNQGAREAAGSYLLFLDSDTILPGGTLDRFRELCRSGAFDAVSGLEVLPPVINNWVGWFRTLQVQDNFGEFRSKEGEIAAWGSTLGGVRRQLFFDCGGFNEAFKGADVEDHELAVKLCESGRVIFCPGMTYRHSYTTAAELLRKQFCRAAQMVQLPQTRMIGHSLLFRWHYKGGHILSVLVLAGVVAAAMNRQLLPVPVLALLAKLALNRYLFGRALLEKGPLFLAYSLAMSLATGGCIVAGALYGTLRQIRS